MVEPASRLPFIPTTSYLCSASRVGTLLSAQQQQRARPRGSVSTDAPRFVFPPVPPPIGPRL
eukprot:6923663-Pyramimonas_sp.AAC.1